MLKTSTSNMQGKKSVAVHDKKLLVWKKPWSAPEWPVLCIDFASAIFKEIMSMFSAFFTFLQWDIRSV